MGNYTPHMIFFQTMSKILKYRLWAGMTTEDPTFSICYPKKKGWIKLNVCPRDIVREVEPELVKVTIN